MKQQCHLLVFLATITVTVTVASSRTARILPEFNNEPDLVLEAGYPGWEAPKFKRAPQPAQGRFLYYRKNPKVEKYRSAVHELYMRPYNYARENHAAVAVVNTGDVRGTIHFYQNGGPTAPLMIVGNLTGLSPGKHGFHVHQLGDLTNGCKSMAGHFNPNQVTHGAPYDVRRHAGDLGNIKADGNGVARIEMSDRHLSLSGLNSVVGRGLVIHEGEDDMGRGGNDGSLKTGNAGGRLACAVIGLSTPPV